jgi:hypothetical protein
MSMPTPFRAPALTAAMVMRASPQPGSNTTSLAVTPASFTISLAISSGVGTYMTRTRSVGSSRVRSTVTGSPARKVTVRVRVMVV